MDNIDLCYGNRGGRYKKWIILYENRIMKWIDERCNVLDEEMRRRKVE